MSTNRTLVSRLARSTLVATTGAVLAAAPRHERSMHKREFTIREGTTKRETVVFPAGTD